MPEGPPPMETLTDEALLARLPHPDTTDPGYVLPFHNFPGKGWRATIRRRPANMVDLAAKLHDLHYVVNDVHILGRADLRALSGSATGVVEDAASLITSKGMTRARLEARALPARARVVP
ncbi:MAG: hypothetical protein AAF360_15700, partial [Pseudomonadota bacterium]